MADPHEAALVGKAGEALVAAELLRRHVDVAYPAHDRGIDLLAYRAQTLDLVIPIQVKTRTTTCFEFQKAWFCISGLILIQVWHATTVPQFYIFSDLGDVEDALGPTHCATDSWISKGAYNVTTPNSSHLVRMQRYRDRWDLILGKLGR